MIYWMTFLNPGSKPATMQAADYDGNNVDENFLTIDVDIGVPDILLHEGYFYLTTFTISPSFDFDQKIYRVPATKGAVVTPLEFSPPVTHLSGPFGNTGKNVKICTT